MASAWTVSAVGIALVAVGNLAEASRFLERAKEAEQLDQEAGTDFSPLRCVNNDYNTRYKIVRIR